MIAALTAASGAGYLIGHLAMVPAYEDGLKKARAEKALLRERGDMIDLLKNEVTEKNEIIARLQGANMASQEQGDESEKKWAKDSMKPKHHHSRGHSHSSAIAEEEPQTRSL